MHFTVARSGSFIHCSAVYNNHFLPWEIRKTHLVRWAWRLEEGSSTH